MQTHSIDGVKRGSLWMLNMRLLWQVCSMAAGSGEARALPQLCKEQRAGPPASGWGQTWRRPGGSCTSAEVRGETEQLLETIILGHFTISFSIFLFFSSDLRLTDRSSRSSGTKKSGCQLITCKVHDLIFWVHQINDRTIDPTAPADKIGSHGYGRRRRSLKRPPASRPTTHTRPAGPHTLSWGRREGTQSRWFLIHSPQYFSPFDTNPN